jgi:beta-fructofuranosidase
MSQDGKTLTRRALLGAGALAASSRTALSADPDRPQCHFLPPAAWMNDPNGPIWHNAEYHLYYQHNPKAAKWDTMHWGHAASRDLLHWKHLPIALAPTPGGPDKDGCFSGCAVVDSGRPTLIYTGVRPEVQCLATSDDWVTWTKHPRNPVIAAPPPGIDTPGFRDPHVWREGNEWLLLVGAGFRGVGGTALLYSSRDLVEWTYLKPLLTGKIDPRLKGGDVARGEMWECPDFFPVGDKWLLIVSTMGKVLYWLGRWKDRAFTPEQEGVLVHGCYYAPKSCLAADGRRRLIWGWLREERSQEAQLAAGWSGVMSLAAAPSLGRDGGLRLAPAAEYAKLRRKKNARPQMANPECFEARLWTDADCSIERGGAPLLAVDAAAGRMKAGASSAPFKPGYHSVFVDGSVVEVFSDDGTRLAGRVYGARGKIGAAGRNLRIETWDLTPISKDRLTT